MNTAQESQLPGAGRTMDMDVGQRYLQFEYVFRLSEVRKERRYGIEFHYKSTHVSAHFLKVSRFKILYKIMFTRTSKFNLFF